MIATRTFSRAEVAEFALLSGDHNPLHVDPLGARRTQFGECVVHGVLSSLWVLEEAILHYPSATWRHLQVQFLGPVRLEVPVHLLVASVSGDAVSFEIRDRTRVLIRIEIGLGQPGGVARGMIPLSSELPPKETPCSPGFPDLRGLGGAVSLYWNPEFGNRLFPRLSRSCPLEILAALSASTRIVGMKVPGDHSIYVGPTLDLSTGGDGTDQLRYAVSKVSPATGLVYLELSGAMPGRLRAMRRHPPAPQKTLEEIRQLVPSDRFAGRRVLIVGGSRGLGETAAKILAAGGATVALTYHMGEADASRVGAEIRACGWPVSYFQLDVTNSDFELALPNGASNFDHVCYFATPPIADGDGEVFDERLFARFHAIYVAAFTRLGNQLGRSTNGRFHLFLASTVAVESPPLRSLEYAAAKASAEACARWLAARYGEARIHIARFPRLETDQTVSYLSRAEHDAAETVLRELSQWLPMPVSENTHAIR